MQAAASRLQRYGTAFGAPPSRTLPPAAPPNRTFPPCRPVKPYVLRPRAPPTPTPTPLPLSPQDKAMYAVGSLISGNSVARTAIFFYALALHAVIFLILARWVPIGLPGASNCSQGCRAQARLRGLAGSRRYVLQPCLRRWAAPRPGTHPPRAPPAAPAIARGDWGNDRARASAQCMCSMVFSLPPHTPCRTSHRHVEHLEDLEETCLRLQHSHTAAALTGGAAAAAAGGGGGAGGGAALQGGGGDAGSALAAAAAEAAGEAAKQAGAALLRLLRRS